MEQHGRPVSGPPQPPGEQEPVERAQPLAVHEQLAERWVPLVHGGRREHHLGVAGQVDLARTVALVDKYDAADLHVVARRDGDFQARGDAVIALVELRLVRVEDDQRVLVWRA